MLRIKNKIPKLLSERGISAKELMWGARISLNTAKRWVQQEEVDKIESFDRGVIESIATMLDVKDISELFEIVNK